MTWPSFNKALLNEVIKQLKIFHLKILVTYRTSVQGGKGAVNEQEYLNILGELIECPQFDMIDIEWSSAVKIENIRILFNVHNKRARSCSFAS